MHIPVVHDKAVDRRVQKTKRALLNALVDLILEKGYEAVTIQDITGRAKVGRSTFYAHFESKDQLLLGGDNFNVLLTTNTRREEQRGRAPISFLTLYEHIVINHPLTRSLGEEESKLIWAHVKNILAARIKYCYRDKIDQQRLSLSLFDLLSNAVASSLIDMLAEWVGKNMPFAPDQMSDTSHALLKGVFDQYGKKDN